MPPSRSTAAGSRAVGPLDALPAYPRARVRHWPGTLGPGWCTRARAGRARPRANGPRAAAAGRAADRATRSPTPPTGGRRRAGLAVLDRPRPRPRSPRAAAPTWPPSSADGPAWPRSSPAGWCTAAADRGAGPCPVRAAARPVDNGPRDPSIPGQAAARSRRDVRRRRGNATTSPTTCSPSARTGCGARRSRRRVDARPGERVLDLARRHRHLLAAVRRAPARTSCRATSPSACSRVGKQRHPRLPFTAGDATRLPFADGAFDAVTISFGLRNVAGHRRRAARAAAASPGPAAGS